MFERHLSSCCSALLLCACGAGEGTVEVTAYGEAFIEEGIPADAVDDGWAVSFSRFVVALRDVRVAGATIAVPGQVELTTPSSGRGQPLGSARVAEGDHDRGGFVVERVEVEGSATLASESKSFAWVFAAPTRYHDCETTTSVPDGGRATFQITIHADHLLYDSLVADEPQLLFGALAGADDAGDDDGVISEAELAAADIGTYDPGSEGGIDDLWSYLTALTRTLGHVDGEGHCHAEAAD